MIALIRQFTKSWVATVLFGLLIISFAVFGIGNRDLFHARISNAVITAGSRSVSMPDFKREFEGYKSQVEQQVGQPITNEVAAQNGLDRRVLEGVATRESFSALLDKIGIRPSDKLIVAQIQKIPAFFDQVTGRFDKVSYQRALQSKDLSVPAFEGLMRDQLAEQQAGTGLVSGMRLPRAYAAIAAIYTLESRDGAYFAVEPTSVPQPPAPTDAQLTQLMKENAAQLTRPEFRQLSVVRFSPSQVAANLPIDQAELQKRYNFRKDTLSSPETRTVVQIPVKDAQTAARIAGELAKGGDPVAVAKAAGIEAITYANKPKTAIPDAKVAAAAFSTPTGAVATVKGELGVAVLKVLAVMPGKAVTFEEVKPALEAEIRKDQASEKVYALTQAYDDAHQGGASLAAAAAKAGVPVATLGPLTQNGRDLTGQPVPGLTQKLMQTAWALPAGGESEVEDAGNGEYFAVRVEKVIPPAIPPFEEIKPMLTRAWTQRELVKAMQAKADGYVERLKKGESLEAVAASAGSSVTQVPGVTRQSAQQHTELSQDMLGKLFTSRPGDVFTAENSHFGLVVGKLTAVRAGDETTVARAAEQIRPQMSQGYYREILESASVSARQRIKPRIEPNLARQAIGLEPIDPKAEAAKAPAGKAGKPPLAK